MEAADAVECRSVDVDPLGDALQTREIALAPLDAAHVGVVDAEDIGEGLLAESTGFQVDTSCLYDVHMADVGVRELKQRLSEYLDRAERGELVRVTDRGRPKALLGPLPGRARLEEGVAEGWITPGSKSGLGEVQRWKSRERVLDALSEDRAE